MLDIGSRIGQYEIIGPGNKGGMAEVFRARHLTLKREVALKVLYPHLTSDQDFIARFEREANAQAKLKHPNIAEVYDAGYADGYHYMAMEFITGGSVSDVLNAYRTKQQHMPIDEAMTITKQIASALSLAHKNNLVHRDVKPSNILVLSNPDGKATRYLLTDFGIVLAQGATKVTKHAGTIIGTPEYMSPEQGKGFTVDHTSDLYSLGCVCYELLTSNPPFMGDAWAVIINQIQTEAPAVSRVRPEVPRQVQIALAKLLEKQPKNRFQSADAFIAALEAAPPRPPLPLWGKVTIAAAGASVALASVVLLSPVLPSEMMRSTINVPVSISPSMSPSVPVMVISLRDANAEGMSSIMTTSVVLTATPVADENSNTTSITPQPTVTLRPIPPSETAPPSPSATLVPPSVTPVPPTAVPTVTLLPPTAKPLPTLVPPSPVPPSPIPPSPTMVPPSPTPAPPPPTEVPPTPISETMVYAPSGNPNHPCSLTRVMKFSNLCVQPPYPVPAGGTAKVIWRITSSFSFGEFDSGDGQGFRGPIPAEFIVDINGVNRARMIKLRWRDSEGTVYQDVMLINIR